MRSGSPDRRRPPKAGLARLLRELDRPLEPEFILHAYTRLVSRIMRRSWKEPPDNAGPREP